MSRILPQLPIGVLHRPGQAERGHLLPPAEQHTHTSAERMVLVSGEMEVEYRGQPPATIRTGNYAYGPAGHPHSVTCLDAGECVLFIAFEDPIDAEPTRAPQD